MQMALVVSGPMADFMAPLTVEKFSGWHLDDGLHSIKLTKHIVNALTTTTALGYPALVNCCQSLGHLEQSPFYPRPESVWVTIETEPISVHYSDTDRLTVFAQYRIRGENPSKNEAIRSLSKFTQ